MSAEEIHELSGQTPGAAPVQAPGATADTRPQPLTLSSVSRDGRRLHLVDTSGHEFTLEVDDRLRGALRGDSARIGQLEITMEASLRPRDIQARIRAGESPESVAAAANTTVEKIMPYAVPVMAEREHITQRAMKASVRRRGGEPGAARTLGEAVAAHLGRLDVDADSVEWDAWRRSDGRWSLVGLYTNAKRSGTAELTFDARGSFVVLDNDDARWLVGDLPEPSAEPVADDLQRARQRRLSPAPGLDEQLPLGEDAVDLVREQPVEAYLDPTPAPVTPASPVNAAAPSTPAAARVDEPLVDADAPTPEQPAVTHPVVGAPGPPAPPRPPAPPPPPGPPPRPRP